MYFSLKYAIFKPAIQVKKDNVFNFEKIKKFFYTSCYTCDSPQLVYQGFLIQQTKKKFLFSCFGDFSFCFHGNV